jgi:hypothetical protein
MLSPILVLQSALLNYRHILKLKVLKYRRRKIYSYILLSLHKQVRISIKYLAEQFNKFSSANNKYSLVEKLTIFVLNMFFKTPLVYGRFLQNSSQVHKIIKDKQRRPFKKKNRKGKKKQIGNKKSSELKSNLRKNRRKVKKIKGKFQTIRPFKKKKGLRAFKFKKRFKRFILKKRYRKKLNEYTYSLSSLYNDLNTSSDLSIISDIHTTKVKGRKNHSYVTKAKYPIPFAKMLLYVILGKSYRLLENSYNLYFSPVWHQYVLKSKKFGGISPFFLNSLSSTRNLKGNKVDSKEGSPTHQRNLFLKQLSIFLQYQSSKDNNQLVNLSQLNLSDANILLSLYKHSHTHLKRRILARQREKMLLQQALATKAKKKRASNKLKKKLRISLLFKLLSLKKKKNIFFSDRQSFILLVKRVYFKLLCKSKKRGKHFLKGSLYTIRKYFYFLLRFKLMRLIWLTLRAFHFRRVVKLRTKKNLTAANSIITYVK